MPTAQTSKALALSAMLSTLAACSSNPPPRPLPSPAPRAEAPAQAQPERSAQQQADRASEPQTPIQTPAQQPAEQTTDQQAADRQPSARTQPDWYKPGVQTLDGAEHRAFAATATDVRDARRRAMAEAYDAYPKGQVAAYQAVRLADGGWRFYVLMAAGG